MIQTNIYLRYYDLAPKVCIFKLITHFGYYLPRLFEMGTPTMDYGYVATIPQ